MPSLSPHHFIGFGRHQLVQIGAVRERIGEGHKLAAAADQAATGGHVGNVAELRVRDVEEFGQFLPVSGTLVEQDEKFRVCQHQAGGIGAQQLVYILRQAGDQPVILANALPEFVEEVGAVLVSEQNVKFVRHDPGAFAAFLVLDDAVVDRVQRHQHPQRHELFTQFPDVVVDDAGLGIHIGVLGKGVERARNEQFAGQRQALGLRLRLEFEQLVKIPQRRRRALVAVADVGLVDELGAAAKDRFLLGRHLPAAHQLLVQRQHELAFGDNGVSLIAVAAVHVQRVDVGVGCGRDLDDLAAQRTGQVTELAFRVEDQDVILGRQRDLHQFLFGAHRLAGPGHTQTERIAVEQLCAVGHDHILADGILTVVDTTRLQNFLRTERDQHGGALGGQRAQGLDAAQTVGQHGVEAVFLLPAQRREMAQMFASYRLQGLGITVELLLAVGHVDERYQPEHHALVAGGQVVQHLLGLLALEFHVVGDRSRPVVGGVLLALPVGDVGFHPQQRVLHLAGGLVGGHRQDVDGQHHAAVKVAEFRDEAVLDIAGIILQIQHPPEAGVDLEVVGGELHAVGAEPVLEAVAALRVLAQVEIEGRRLTGLEEIPQQPQPVWRGQLRRHRAELGEMRDQVSADAGEVGAGLVDVPLDDADGQIPLPHHAVAGAGDLGAEHLVEFFAVVVEVVAVQGQQHRPLEVLLVDTAVVDGDLGRRAGVQGVEQGAVVEEHRHFVVFIGDGVVDVGEGPAFAVLIAHLEDAVRPDTADGDGVLHRARDLELDALLALGSCQRFGQWRASGAVTFSAIILFFFMRFLRFDFVFFSLVARLRLQPSAMEGCIAW